MRASKEAKVVGMRRSSQLQEMKSEGQWGALRTVVQVRTAHCSLTCKCHSHMRTCTDVLQYVGSGGTLNRAI